MSSASGGRASGILPALVRSRWSQRFPEGLLKPRRGQACPAPELLKTWQSRGRKSAGEKVSTQKREHRMKELTKIIVAGVSTVALAGGIGAGLAYADTPSDEPTATPSVATAGSPTEIPTAEPSGKRDQNGLRKRLVRGHLRFVARALHGEVTLAGAEHRVIAFQRGEVQKVNSKSVT